MELDNNYEWADSDTDSAYYNLFTQLYEKAIRLNQNSTSSDKSH